MFVASKTPRQQWKIHPKGECRVMFKEHFELCSGVAEALVGVPHPYGSSVHSSNLRVRLLLNLRYMYMQLTPFSKLGAFIPHFPCCFLVKSQWLCCLVSAVTVTSL
jgi:hypothetical protein